MFRESALIVLLVLESSSHCGPVMMCLGPKLFNIFINDLDNWIDELLIKLLYNPKLGGLTHTQDDGLKLQFNLYKLEDLV